MKVLEVKIQNIRVIESLHWQLPPSKSPAGWHVILGDNGSGKSSFLRSIAIGLLGLERASALLLDYASLIRQNTAEGSVSLTIQPEANDELDTTNTNVFAMVLGVGGSGSNAVDYMYKQGVKGVEFAVCNTDHLALINAITPTKLQIGAISTGTDGNYDIGRQAALESQKQLRNLLNKGTKMLFIIAGMGGGTGSGAAPIIAEIARSLGILTVAIVTSPFQFEGRRKRDQAVVGIRELGTQCDSILAINLDKLRQLYGGLTLGAVFLKADELLMTAVKTIAELNTTSTDVNVDFEDLREVLKGSGTFLMGSSTTKGYKRARRAAEEVMTSPFFQDIDIHGTRKILLSIMSGKEAGLEMDELSEITEFILNKVGDESEMIFGHGNDDTLGENIRVIAFLSGFPNDRYSTKQYDLFLPLPGQISPNFEQEATQEIANQIELDNLLHRDLAIGGQYKLQVAFDSNQTTYLPLATSTENGSKFVFQSLWGRKSGWFSAGFGPFRRFTGGDVEYDKLFDSSQHKKLAAHLSLFKENVAFNKITDWLLSLKLRSLEDDNHIFLTYLEIFINQPDFLPHGTQLYEINSKGVFFRNSNGNIIGIEDLSDGFRSVLSLAFELLRQLESEYRENVFDKIFYHDRELNVRVNISGIVLIDEIDAHLHPIWQKEIGYWLTKQFPNIQFFVTTHSPLVCQAAENGSVFHLPRPGSNEVGGMVSGVELQRLIYGNVLEAYGTEVFGLVSTQSEAGQEKTHRLTALNERALIAELTSKERQERDELRATLPISDSEDFLNKLLSDL